MSGDPSITNLRQAVLNDRGQIRKVDLVLLSLMSPTEVANSEHFGYARSDLTRLSLFGILVDRGGQLSLRPAEFNLDPGPIGRPTY